MASHQLAARPDRQPVDDPYDRRHFMRFQPRPAELAQIPRGNRIAHHDVGHHNGARHRIAAAHDRRHDHRGVQIDHRLHFLGVYFLAAYVDRAVAPAGENIPVAAQFHGIAGIDRAIGPGDWFDRAIKIAPCHARRTYMKRTVPDRQFHARWRIFQHGGAESR
jgi:hypothetical protein